MSLEKGYSKDFEEGSIKDEMISLWEQIHNTLLKILTSSINFIYSKDMDVVASLHKQLQTSSSQALDNSSVELEYLSSPQVSRQLLSFEDDSQLELLMNVFGQLAIIRGKSFGSALAKFELGTKIPIEDKTSIVSSSIEFM